MTRKECRVSKCVFGKMNPVLGGAEPYETVETREAYVLGAGFVGRKQQLAQLRACLRSMRVGEPERECGLHGA